ncbi:hybrid sensor histidine kinase/response regulator [Roseovarius aquimarinus]|uniref:histidine kinase n=1 Tax=Roseovarius aquimarinus TaxID=1229156 RepID=A0ABW7I570_9RHOB
MKIDDPKLEAVLEFIRDSPDPVAVFDGEGRLIFENAALERLGCTASLVGYLAGNEGSDTLAMGLKRSKQTPFAFLDGERRLKGQIRRINTATGLAVAAVRIQQTATMADLTKLRRSQSAAGYNAFERQAVSERFSAFFENAQAGMGVLNGMGRFVLANPAMEKLLGRPEARIRGRTLEEMVDIGDRQGRLFTPGVGESHLAPDAAQPFDAIIPLGDGDIPVEISLTERMVSRRAEFFVVIRDMTESRRLKEVRELNAQLAAAQRVRDDFIRLMSHEMRTPLSTLVSAAETLQQQPGLDEETANRAHQIEEAARDALTQYSSILSLSRGSAHRASRLLPSDLIDRLLRQYAPTAERNKIRLEGAAYGAALKEVPVDPTAAFLIMTNLVSNALKHTPAGGEVRCEVRAKRDERILELSVRDSGTGVPEALRPHIFEPYRTGAGEMEIDVGLGVGLSLVKRAVDDAGGMIEMQSETDMGTTFIITLPFLEIEQQEQIKETARREGLDLAPMDRILVIDDDAVSREILTATLRSHGFDAEAVDDGAAAVELLSRPETEWPRMIFLDREMPGLNGADTARRIRGLQGERKPYICGLTAYLDDLTMTQLLEAGVDHVEEKPFSRVRIEQITGLSKARPPLGAHLSEDHRLMARSLLRRETAKLLDMMRRDLLIEAADVAQGLSRTLCVIRADEESRLMCGLATRLRQGVCPRAGVRRRIQALGDLI